MSKKTTGPLTATAKISTKDGLEYRITTSRVSAGVPNIASFDAVEALTLLIKHSTTWLVCDDGVLVPIANISSVRIF